MSDRFSDNDFAGEALSALADGEAQPHEVARACAAWKDQADVRANWHAYQLIGDVMRSDDLARSSQGDAFLASFRARLAQEPVVLAPVAANANRPAASQPAATAVSQPLRRRAWAGPMAVAAGFVMVVGALLGSQGILPGAGSSLDVSLAQAVNHGPASDLALSLGDAPVGGASGLVALSADEASFSKPQSGEALLIRDPRLDQALVGHRSSLSSESSFAGRSGLTRQVVFDGR